MQDVLCLLYSKIIDMNIYILQGSRDLRQTHFKCGGKQIQHFVINFLLILTVKEFG